jgi:AcrR family transcriptional regulator
MPLDEAAIRAARQKGGATRVARNRQSILDAAGGLFSERGYEGARIDDIAKEAGVVVATVYNVFPGGKPTLAAAVWYQHFSDRWSHTVPALGGDVPALEVLHGSIRCMVETARAHIELTNAMLTGIQAATMKAGGPPTSPDDPRLFAPLPALLEPIVAEAQRADDLRGDLPPALLAIHMINSTLLRVMTRPKASARSTFDLAWTLLLHGVKA